MYSEAKRIWAFKEVVSLNLSEVEGCVGLGGCMHACMCKMQSKSSEATAFTCVMMDTPG